MRTGVKIKQHDKPDNAGMSLIELIVVILILGILSTGLIIGISSVRNASVTNCAERLSKLLDKTRLEAMSKSKPAVLQISRDAAGDYYGCIYYGTGSEREAGDKELLGNKGLKITVFKYAANGIDAQEEENFPVSPVEIGFSKGSGAFSSDYGRIEISSSKTVCVYLVKETGRNYIK